jgi:hypothetical protein
LSRATPRSGHARQRGHAGRQDADHGGAHAVERDGAADRGGRAAERAHRQLVRHDDDGGRARRLVARLHQPPSLGAHAERREVARRGPADLDPLRSSGARQCGLAPLHHPEGVEAALLVADGLGVRRGQRPGVGGGIPLHDLHQAAGVRIRERGPQQRVHDAEHRRAGPDPEPQHHHHRRREPRVPAQGAKGEERVGQHIRQTNFGAGRLHARRARPIIGGR